MEDLRVWMAANSTIAAAVGLNSRSNDKAIRVERLFQNDPFPGIVLNLKSGGVLNDLSGSNLEFNAEVLVSCVAGSAKAANDLASLVNGQIEPFRGATAHGFVDSVTFDDERSGFEPFDDSSDQGAYITELHYVIFYRQTS